MLPKSPLTSTPSISLDEINDLLLSIPTAGEVSIDETRRPKGADGIYTSEDDQIMLDNMNLIINEAAKYDLDTNQLAYVFATAHWESGLGGDMTERFDGDANEYFIKLYWDDVEVKGDLGNIVESDAYVYSGRGFTQLTGRLGYTYYKDYLGIELLNNPLLATEPQTAVQIMVHGMVNGIFKSLSYTDDSNTVAQAGGGKSLFDFEFPEQFVDARIIVSSGDAEAIAAIANLYACLFETLCLAGALPASIICASGDCQ